MKPLLSLACGSVLFAAMGVTAPVNAALVVTPTTDSNALGTSLGGSGLTINSVSLAAGAGEQVGTYTGFNSGPITFGDGVVLSTGLAANSVGPAVPADLPDDDLGLGGTSEFDAYAQTKISNFQNSNDVVGIKVNFTLAQPSAVSFKSIFGSVEFPGNGNALAAFSDAFFTFLDGTTNQISFLPNGDVVQVNAPGAASLVTTADTNTAFGDPHGLIPEITTTTAVLAAGEHSLLFLVGDVNDANLNSSVFISGLSAVTQPGGGGGNPNPVPLPPALPMLGFALAGLLGIGRRKK